MAENGVASRVASTFENDFREFNGRPPTIEETKRHLAFDRLAKTSSLDPATVLLIVDAGRNGAADTALEAIVERVERLQQSVDDLAKRSVASAGSSEPSDPLQSAIRYFYVFVAGAVVCELVFALVGFGWLAPPVFDRVGMFCLGLIFAAAAPLWLWLAPRVNARRG